MYAHIKQLDICQEIDLCYCITLQALQVFYPYSMQIFPNKFPGSDPNDCPRDATKEM